MRCYLLLLLLTDDVFENGSWKNINLNIIIDNFFIFLVNSCYGSIHFACNRHLINIKPHIHKDMWGASNIHLHIHFPRLQYFHILLFSHPYMIIGKSNHIFFASEICILVNLQRKIIILRLIGAPKPMVWPSSILPHPWSYIQFHFRQEPTISHPESTITHQLNSTNHM